MELFPWIHQTGWVVIKVDSFFINNREAIYYDFCLLMLPERISLGEPGSLVTFLAFMSLGQHVYSVFFLHIGTVAGLC